MVPTNPPRPRLFRLRTDDPEKAIDDPALALLAATGWRAVASFPAEERKGTEMHRFVVIVLWPPALPVEASGSWWISRIGNAARWIAILLALAIGVEIASVVGAIALILIVSQLA